MRMRNPLNRRQFIAAASLSDPVRRAAAEAFQGAPAGGPILCRVVDAESRRPVPARVRLVDSGGREVVPLGHSALLSETSYEGDVRFYSRRFAYVDGEFSIDSSWLPLTCQVIKGYEFLITDITLRAGDLRDGAFTIPLARWSSLSRRGWYSGDIHIHHMTPRACRQEMEAEDVNVAIILTTDISSDQDRFEGKESRFSSGDRIVYVDQEFRNPELGHVCLLNLKKLIEPVKPARREHYPLHLEVCEQAHKQGGYATWAHYPSWPGVESPLDVALEQLDGLEVLSVLDPREPAIFTKEFVPEPAANHGLRLWYRYLNCGFRLTATAGTDKMTTFVTVGANRVYARVDGAFTYQNWIEALRAGRTFITNSPLLAFSVNGAESGTTLRLDSSRHKILTVRASAESQLPYDRLEIVVNGETVAEASPSGKRHHAEIKLRYPLTTSCWIAARACENLDSYHSRGIDFSKIHSDHGTLLGNHYGTRRPEGVFAHSSPVYVVLDGRPIRSWEDAQYYIRCLDSAVRWLGTSAKFVRPADREAAIEAFMKGKAIYEQRARQARRL